MSAYVESKKARVFPLLPLEGNLDLTHRCNNNCRHCWINLPQDSPAKENELSFDEILRIIDDARKLGCKKWLLSGGEPMLRGDFPEILDFITRKSTAYNLNTNGTLITPPIARLMKRKGRKMVSLYGASAGVHDHITRSPGSFDAAMRGFAYLREAGAGFIVQVVPMKDNHHQFKAMVHLALSLSPYWRVGANWLFLRADGNAVKNREILLQRLDPADVVKLMKADLLDDGVEGEAEAPGCRRSLEDRRLFAACLASRRDFHIDPYGRMSFCCSIVDPSLRYDLRRGRLEEGWTRFIPSLAGRVTADREYLEHCGPCELQTDCECPAFAYLEHRRYTAKVEYFCALIRELRRCKKNLFKSHRRYYRIAGISLRVDSDLRVQGTTFHPKFRKFRAGGPGVENITIRHHFFIPDLNGQDLGKKIYRKPPWTIYRKGDGWIFLHAHPGHSERKLHQIAFFSPDFTRAVIYHETDHTYRLGNLASLTLLATDQVLLASVLGGRKGCILHASGLIFRGRGFLFVGHSRAGKSTVVRLLKDQAEILCDDRMIVRRHPEGFRIHGTWCHGTEPEVSSSSAPLRAVFFLKKAGKTRILPVGDRKAVLRRLLACLIKPLSTADWWDNMLALVGGVAAEIPCYMLHFEKDGPLAEVLEDFCRAEPGNPSRLKTLPPDDRTRAR
jgi:MoaA/NifB/PqqE/SkfB family radical SAM enzyme